MKKFIAAGIMLVLSMALAESVPAQKLYTQGDCLFRTSVRSAQPAQLVGCYAVSGGRLWYMPAGSVVMNDIKTGQWFQVYQGVQYIYTRAGWQRADQNPLGRQVLAEIAAANQQGTNVIVGGTGQTGTGSGSGRGTNVIVGAPAFNPLEAANARMTDTWTRPAPAPYYGGSRR